MIRTSEKMKRRFEIDAESLPDVPGIMLVVVEALKDLGGSATIRELDEKVIELEGVTETEQAFTLSRDENRTRVNFYLAWARTYLKRGNALVNSSRGVWALTESGAAITGLHETREIYEKVTLEERERARAKRQAALQGRADKGLFITTGHFSNQASDEATRDGAIAIDLIDGNRLCDLLKENRLGVKTKRIERVRIQSNWFENI